MPLTHLWIRWVCEKKSLILLRPAHFSLRSYFDFWKFLWIFQNNVIIPNCWYSWYFKTNSNIWLCVVFFFLWRPKNIFTHGDFVILPSFRPVHMLLTYMFIRSFFPQCWILHILLTIKAYLGLTLGSSLVRFVSIYDRTYIEPAMNLGVTVESSQNEILVQIWDAW